MTTKHSITFSLILIAFSVPDSAQTSLPEAPSSLKSFAIANGAMYFSSVLNAHAIAYGSHQCMIEIARAHLPISIFGTSGSVGGLFHPWRDTLVASLPIDAALSATSFWLRRRHHNTMALLIPSVSAGAQMGVAAVHYAEGCF